MTAREQLIEAVQTLPESQISQVLAYINQILPEDHQNQQYFDQSWWDNLQKFTPDFLPVRQQPQLPNREDIF
ncbi:MAG: hypothetical protein EA366_09955 [Spirulina sp. DLM2.Bin59]|nr:MAG: hypothetical protein EA366_09955 [Spirulina sp. DLM2.Bin59]